MKRNEMLLTIRARFAAATILALCAAPQAAVSASPPLEIPAFISQTGSFAFVGEQQAKSLAAIQDYVNKGDGINGRQLKFLIYDDHSSPQVSAQLMSQAISINAPIVIGGGNASTCNAAAGLIHDSGPLLYCLTAGVHPAAGSFVFSTGFSSVDQIGAAVSYFRERGWHKVALLTTNDASGQDADRTIDSVFSLPENHSETIVAREHFSIGDISLAAQVARIRSANTDAVLAWVTGSPLGTVLHAFRDAGIDLPLVSTSGNASYTELDTFRSLLPSKMLFASQIVLVPAAAPKASRDAIAKFYTQYKAMNIRPDTGYTTTWDMAMIVVAALRKYGGSPTSVQLRDYLQNVRDWNGILGRFDFHTYPQRGLGPNSIPIIRWNAARDAFELVRKGSD